VVQFTFIDDGCRAPPPRVIEVKRRRRLLEYAEPPQDPLYRQANKNAQFILTEFVSYYSPNSELSQATRFTTF